MLKEGDGPQNDQGYTLLEVMLVLLLVMLIARGIAPQFSKSAAWTRQKADAANRLRIEGAVRLYQIDTGRTPAAVNDLIVQPAGETGWRGPYLQQIPPNPYAGGTAYRLDQSGKVIAP